VIDENPKKRLSADTTPINRVSKKQNSPFIIYLPDPTSAGPIHNFYQLASRHVSSNPFTDMGRIKALLQFDGRFFCAASINDNASPLLLPVRPYISNTRIATLYVATFFYLILP
jgi:hypothetical protein